MYFCVNFEILIYVYIKKYPWSWNLVFFSIFNQEMEIENLKYFKWKDIRQSDHLIVVDQNVFDVSNFKKKHPGGEQIINNHIGQDASV